MEFLIFWIFFALLVAVLAANRGRSGVGFFLLALIFSPIVAIIVALIMGPKETAGPTKACPYCAERIKAAAIVCRHCGRELRGGGDALRSLERTADRAGGEAAITDEAVERLKARQQS